MKDLNSSKNWSINNKELITYFKDKNQESENKYRKFETSLTKLEWPSILVIVSPIATSITKCVTGFGVKKVPVPAGVAVVLSLGKRTSYWIVRKN